MAWFDAVVDSGGASRHRDPTSWLSSLLAHANRHRRSRTSKTSRRAEKSTLGVDRALPPTDRPGVCVPVASGSQHGHPVAGHGQGERDPGLLLALARFGDAAAVVLLAQDRRYAERPLGPAGLREARRGMRLAPRSGYHWLPWSTRRAQH